MECPPCSGTGKAWGFLIEPCPLCEGRGTLSDERIDQPRCKPCGATGRKGGFLTELCPVCGGWGRLPPPAHVKDSVSPKIPWSSAKWRTPVRIISATALIVSLAWLIYSPGFDPLVTLLLGLAGFLGSLKGKQLKKPK